ncbi:MAG: methylated-DNA--[protein]-cysteine S-methyltransferase [Bacteroidales bacterium]|nr:methylated-DNA--[protein]-cysteine S-methyltransferase [Bacteroidales bacterium]
MAASSPTRHTAPTGPIMYGTATCELGILLLAATDQGVCALVLGDESAKLESWLQQEFPHAPLAENIANPFQRDLLSITQALDQRQPLPQLALDPVGTPFQHRVWAALQTIPAGVTRTYTQVAAGLGAPTAVRAVARACATNPVSLLIPCHRVVGADGSLRGYRWGLERKRRLLDWEHAAHAENPRVTPARRRV